MKKELEIICGNEGREETAGRIRLGDHQFSDKNIWLTKNQISKVRAAKSNNVRLFDEVTDEVWFPNIHSDYFKWDLAE